MSGKTIVPRKKKSKLKIVLLVIFLILIAAFTAGFCITTKEMNRSFGRGSYGDPDTNITYRYDHYEENYPRKEYRFRSGDNVLTGWVYGADNDKGLIVFAHGIGVGHESYLTTLTSLVDKGWRIFAYDATGSCESEGKGTIGLDQSALDLDRALCFVENEKQFDGLPVYVLGHSWGGFASCAVLNFDHNIRAVVSLSGYDNALAELCETCDGMYGKASKLLYPCIWAYNTYTFGKYSSLSAYEGINKSGIPVLVVHGTEDETIAYNGASIIAQKDKITNPLVEYYTFDEDGMNTHAGYLHSKEYQQYKKDNHLQDKFDTLDKENASIDEYKKYWASVDRELYNQPDTELVDMISDFFEKAA